MSIFEFNDFQAYPTEYQCLIKKNIINQVTSTNDELTHIIQNQNQWANTFSIQTLKTKKKLWKKNNNENMINVCE